jgi:hypothetical protein
VRPAVLLTSLLLGCNAEQDPSRDQMVSHGGGANGASGARDADSPNQVIDLAEALTPLEEQSLARQLSGLKLAAGRTVTVILIEPQGQSLEQVGWAVGKGMTSSRPIMILADPALRQVRIEGELPPEAKAQVAAAMQQGLAAGQVRQSVSRGLIRLSQVTTT